MRKKLFVAVDGVTYSQDDGLGIDVETDIYSLPYEFYEHENGAQSPAWRAGLTTTTITKAGKVVYHGTDMPTRTETEDSITYTFPPALTPDDTQEVYAIGKNEYGSKDEALAALSRSMGMIVMGGNWTDVTTFQDAANKRKVYRLLADLSGPMQLLS